MNMPILEPLPIVTKGLPWYKQTLQWLVGKRRWRLAEDFKFYFKGFTYFIPKGFITDFASIPRPFWFILAPTGIMMIPALFHDFYYQYHYLLVDGFNNEKKRVFEGNGKSFGDKFFREISRYVNEMSAPSWAAFGVLGFAGWPAWWKHRRKDNA